MDHCRHSYMFDVPLEDFDSSSAEFIQQEKAMHFDRKEGSVSLTGDRSDPANHPCGHSGTSVFHQKLRRTQRIPQWEHFPQPLSLLNGMLDQDLFSMFDRK